MPLEALQTYSASKHDTLRTIAVGLGGVLPADGILVTLPATNLDKPQSLIGFLMKAHRVLKNHIATGMTESISNELTLQIGAGLSASQATHSLDALTKLVRAKILEEAADGYV